jgi:hypothetical protein
VHAVQLAPHRSHPRPARAVRHVQSEHAHCTRGGGLQHQGRGGGGVQKERVRSLCPLRGQWEGVSLYLFI